MKVPAPPKANTKAKAKTLKAKKVVPKGVLSHKRSTYHLPSHDPRHCISKGSPDILERAPPRETSLTTMPSSSSPLTTESVRKKIEDNNTLVFILDVKANKHQIKQALKKLYDTLTWPR
ncbi:60S ribosomal protein L23a-like [Zalophus californianus]|uniref:60S ribosomal protein L23a-like n=1 Tax=Zalophus californianus TaxID=9704 RepID=A0A6P9EZH7_ZALCA|nr:60S ribosomal protein L23a-like [Zalophus californianus]